MMSPTVGDYKILCSSVVFVFGGIRGKDMDHRWKACEFVKFSFEASALTIALLFLFRPNTTNEEWSLTKQTHPKPYPASSSRLFVIA